MRIAVTTPTGNVGGRVARGLVRAGHTPVLLARHPDRIDDDLAGFTEVREVDLFDERSAVAATAGVDAVYWVDPSVAGDDPLADYDRVTASAAAAVRANDISRVVFQSSIGAEKRHGAGEIDGLAATEVALNGTDADVTHLRCGYFFSNLLLQSHAVAAGRLEVVLPLDQPMAWVAPADIADVAVGLLLSDAWSGKRVQAVHGPVDLSWSEVARIVGDAIGRRVEAARITDERMRDGLLQAGMSPKFADAVLGMSTGLRDGFEPEQPRTAQTTTPRTLAAWAYDELRPAVSG